MNTNPTPDALADLIAELRWLLAKATPAPWEWDIYARGYCLVGRPGKLSSARQPVKISHAHDDGKLIAKGVSALSTLLDSLEAFHAKPGNGNAAAFAAGQEAFERIGVTDDLRRVVRASLDNDAKPWTDVASDPTALQSPPPVVSGELPAGMVPWAGGEPAPADWDGGPVLLANGDLYAAPVGHQWLAPFGENYVVAYTPKSPPVVEEWRREAVATDYAQQEISSAIDYTAETLRLIFDKHSSIRRGPLGSRLNSAKHRLVAAKRILALTPVEGVVTRSARLALMYLETGFLECEQCGNECKTKDMDAAYELRDALASTPATAQGDVREAIRAAHAIFEQATDFYTARNGRRMSIEGDDGEKCWIVPFDAFEDLRHALATLKGQDNG